MKRILFFKWSAVDDVVFFFFFVGKVGSLTKDPENLYTIVNVVISIISLYLEYSTNIMERTPATASIQALVKERKAKQPALVLPWPNLDLRPFAQRQTVHAERTLPPIRYKKDTPAIGQNYGV